MRFLNHHFSKSKLIPIFINYYYLFIDPIIQDYQDQILLNQDFAQLLCLKRLLFDLLEKVLLLVQPLFISILLFSEAQDLRFLLAYQKYWRPLMHRLMLKDFLQCANHKDLNKQSLNKNYFLQDFTLANRLALNLYKEHNYQDHLPVFLSMLLLLVLRSLNFC